MLFFWRKYEGDGWSTFASMMGSILCVAAAILAAAGISALLGNGTLGGIITLVVGIAVLVLAKILVNMLTDKLHNKIVGVAGNRAVAYINKQVSEKDRILETFRAGTDQKAIFKGLMAAATVKVTLTMQDELLGISKLTSQEYVNQLIQKTASMNRNFTTGQYVHSPYYDTIMPALLDQLDDPSQRDMLRQRYGL